MPSFSERYGYAAPQGIPIPEQLKPETVRRVWSVFYLLKYQHENDYLSMSIDFSHYARRLWFRFYKLPVDEIPDGGRGVVDAIRSTFYNYSWLEILDFIEFHLKTSDASHDEEFRGLVNLVFEEENEAYRVIGGQVVCITDEAELEAVEVSLSHSGEFAHISAHIEAALKLLSDRPKPDFRNAIKEAISAVEAASKAITRDSHATLGQALKKVPGLHEPMRDAFFKLYGYTSNANGIRHALMDDPNLTQAEAKFMVVACASFSNYLVESAQALAGR